MTAIDYNNVPPKKKNGHITPPLPSHNGHL